MLPPEMNKEHGTRKASLKKELVSKLVTKVGTRNTERGTRQWHLWATVNMDDDALCHRLLFGDPSLGTIENRVILEATISFIKNSGRFD